MATVLKSTDPTVTALNFAALMNQLAQFKARQTENKIKKIELRHTEEGIMSSLALQESQRAHQDASAELERVRAVTARLMREPDRLGRVATTAHATALGKSVTSTTRRDEEVHGLRREGLEVGIDLAETRIKESEANIRAKDAESAAFIGGALAESYQDNPGGVDTQTPSTPQTSPTGDVDLTGGSLGAVTPKPISNQNAPGVQLPLGTGGLLGMAEIALKDSGLDPSGLNYKIAVAEFIKKMQDQDMQLRKERAQLNRQESDRVDAAAEKDSVLDLLLLQPQKNAHLIKLAYEQRHFGRKQNPAEDQDRVDGIKAQILNKYREISSLRGQYDLSETQLRTNIRQNEAALALRQPGKGEKLEKRLAIDRKDLGNIDRLHRDIKALEFRKLDVPHIFPYKGTNWGPYDGPVNRTPQAPDVPRRDPQNILTPSGLSGTLSTATPQGTADEQKVTIFKSQPLESFAANANIRKWSQFPLKDQNTYLRYASAEGLGSVEAKEHFQWMLDRRTEVQITRALKPPGAGIWTGGAGAPIRQVDITYKILVKNAVVTTVSKREYQKEQDRIADELLRFVKKNEKKKKPKTDSVARRTGTYPSSYYSGGS